MNTARVPYFEAVKEPNPVKGLLYALKLFLIRGKQTRTYKHLLNLT